VMKILKAPLLLLAAFHLALAFIPAVFAQSSPGRKALKGHVPAAVGHLQSLGRLPATTNLYLAIGLPLRDPQGLTNFLQELYDPASTNYHQYLSSEQFTERFGPSQKDYQTVTG